MAQILVLPGTGQPITIKEPTTGPAAPGGGTGGVQYTAPGFGVGDAFEEVSLANPFPVSPDDRWLQEAAGNVSGTDGTQKFGRNPSIGTTREAIWYGGGAYTGWLTAASAVRIKAGGDANDDAAGTGARKVMISGLDETWAEAQEEVTTAGASASSATTKTFIRVNRAWVTDCGTYTANNTGDVVIETTGGTTVASLQATVGQTQLALWTVPLGKTAYITDVDATVDAAKPATFFYMQRPDADVVSAPFTAARLFYEIAELTGTYHRHFRVYKGPFAAKTDLWVDAELATGSGGGSASFDIVTIDD